jgi:hypothetical protein
MESNFQIDDEYINLQEAIKLKIPNSNTYLAICNSSMNVYIKDNTARITIDYLIFNFTNTFVEDVEIVIKSPKFGYSNNLNFYNYDESHHNFSIEPFKTYVCENIPKNFKYISKINMSASSLMKLSYELLIEIDVINNSDKDEITTGQTCTLAIPSSIFVNIRENSEHLPFSLKYKLHDMGDSYLAPWEININKFDSQNLTLGNLNVVSNHVMKVEEKNNFIYFLKYLEQPNPRSRNDVVIEFNRTFNDPYNQPYIISKEKLGNDLYFYFCAYPYQQLKDPLKCKSHLLENNKLDNIIYYYTIFIDLGQQMFNSKYHYSNEYAISILNRLPNNSHFRIVAVPEKEYHLDYQHAFTHVFVENNDEHRNCAISYINTLKPTYEKDSELNNYIEKYKNSKAIGHPNIFIFISNLKLDLSMEKNLNPKLNFTERCYYITVDSDSDINMINYFENQLSGLVLSTKFEVDIESNVEKIMKNSLEPFIYYSNFKIPDFVHDLYASKMAYVRNMKFKNCIRSVKEGIELFFKISGNNTQDMEIDIDYVFDDLSNKIQYKGNINVEQNDYDYKIYLKKLFENTNIKSFNKKMGRIQLTINNNLTNYLFTIYYGDECLGNKSWRIDIDMGVVRSEILSMFNQIQNTSDSDWTSEGNAIDFNMKLFDLANKDKIGNEIRIKKPATHVPPSIHETIMNKVNKKKLLDFDEQFVFNRLKVDKKLYGDYLNKLKDGSKKLFKSAFNKIEDSNTKNLAFTVFAVAYLDKNCSKYKKDYEKELKKITKNMEDEYDYDEKFQKEANAVMVGILDSNFD